MVNEVQHLWNMHGHVFQWDLVTECLVTKRQENLKKAVFFTDSAKCNIVHCMELDITVT